MSEPWCLYAAFLVFHNYEVLAGFRYAIDPLAIYLITLIIETEEQRGSSSTFGHPQLSAARDGLDGITVAP
jgi:hypothetical protein